MEGGKENMLRAGSGKVKERKERKRGNMKIRQYGGE